MDVEVILTQDDPKFGKRGQQIKVSPGFAQNFLIPNNKARFATPANLKIFESEKKKKAKLDAESLDRAQGLAKKITAGSVVIPVMTGEGNKLYGSVSTQDIQQALEKQGIIVERKEIHLEEPIRSLGSFQVPVKLHPDVSALLNISVIKKIDG